MNFSRREFMAAATAGLAGSALAGMTSKAEKTRPNIVFFIADDMRPRHFNCLHTGPGKFLTPNLDRLCREGVIMKGQHVV